MVKENSADPAQTAQFDQGLYCLCHLDTAIWNQMAFFKV